MSYILRRPTVLKVATFNGTNSGGRCWYHPSIWRTVTVQRNCRHYHTLWSISDAQAPYQMFYSVARKEGNLFMVCCPLMFMVSWCLWNPDVYGLLYPDVYGLLYPDVYGLMSPDVYGQLYPDVYCLMSTHIGYMLLVHLQIFKTGNQDHGIYFQIINLY